MRRLVVCASSLLLSAALAEGGEPSSEPARIRLKATSEVAEDGTVTSREGKQWIVGKLVATDAEHLTVAAAGKPSVRVPRTAVQRLQVSRGRSRGKAALIGAGVGAVVGLAWGAIEHSRCESSGEGMCDLAYGIPVMTVPVCALVGLAVGKERWVETSPAGFHLGLSPTRDGVRVVGRLAF